MLSSLEAVPSSLVLGPGFSSVFSFDDDVVESFAFDASFASVPGNGFRSKSASRTRSVSFCGSA